MARAQLQQIEESPEALGGVEELTVNTGPSMLDDLNDLDGMFEELEAALPETAKVVGLPANVEPEQPLEVEHHIEAGKSATDDELKKLALEELDEQSEPVSDEAKAPEAGKRKAPVTKRISSVGMTKSVALATALGDDLEQHLTIDSRWTALSEEEQTDKRFALLEEIDGLPVKIGEKVTNLFAAIAKGATLSVYTQMAVDLLMKDGELTSKSLKDAYIARPYSEGTASSQATQMMKLLPTLGLAERAAGKLVVNLHSPLLNKLANAGIPAAPTA
ncbi:MAG: hypothetical protein RR740_00495 [Pseudomonas sp.]